VVLDGDVQYADTVATPGQDPETMRSLPRGSAH